MTKDSPIAFKGTTLKIIHTLLSTADPAALHGALAELTGNSPDFFENELAVLDFSGAPALPEAVDWLAICALFRRSGLNAVATRGLPAAVAAAAAACGLPALAADALARPPRGAARAAEMTPDATPETPPATPCQVPPAAAQPAATPAPARTTVLDKPLRSGQRFYAQGGDLVVLAMVSAGAEVIADGNIHVYAPLRGRALAGAGGDPAARIFTTSLQAELVSIAGIYRTFEHGVPSDLAGRPAKIALADGGLSILPLALS